MTKKYIVRLSIDERQQLETLIKTGKAAAYKRLHAQILLKSDVSEQGSSWTDEKIKAAFDVGLRTVERVRQRLVEHGLDAAINRAKASRTKSRKLDGDKEAHLIALTCSEPPEGRSRWTLRLLADTMVELNYVDSLGHETVRQTLKKTKLSLGKKRNGASHQKPMRNLFAEWKIL